MLPYEEFFKESNFSVARAEEILTAGWTAKGYPPIPLDNIPWENNDPLDRTLAFLLHSLNIIETLLRAYSHTHDVRFLTSAVPAALDWCRSRQTLPLFFSGTAWRPRFVLIVWHSFWRRQKRNLCCMRKRRSFSGSSFCGIGFFSQMMPTSISTIIMAISRLPVR